MPRAALQLLRQSGGRHAVYWHVASVDDVRQGTWLAHWPTDRTCGKASDVQVKSHVQTFTAYHAQRISTAIHLRSAEEIYRNYQHEAAISDTGRRGGRPHMMQAGTRRGRA